MACSADHRESRESFDPEGRGSLADGGSASSGGWQLFHVFGRCALAEAKRHGWLAMGNRGPVAFSWKKAVSGDPKVPARVRGGPEARLATDTIEATCSATDQVVLEAREPASCRDEVLAETAPGGLPGSSAVRVSPDPEVADPLLLLVPRRHSNHGCFIDVSRGSCPVRRRRLAVRVGLRGVRFAGAAVRDGCGEFEVSRTTSSASVQRRCVTVRCLLKPG